MIDARRCIQNDTNVLLETVVYTFPDIAMINFIAQLHIVLKCNYTHIYHHFISVEHTTGIILVVLWVKMKEKSYHL